MGVVANPVVVAESADVVTVDEMRAFLRDYSGQNPLLAAVEFTDTELSTSLNRAVDQANVIARPTGYSLETFPNKYVLLIGAGQFLLMSEAFRQLRNQASYQDGNIQPIGIDDKQAAYTGLAQTLKAEFTQMVTTIKISDNMKQTGSLTSPGYQRWWF